MCFNVLNSLDVAVRWLDLLALLERNESAGVTMNGVGSESHEANQSVTDNV